MSERLLFFNGIRGDTGSYGRGPMDVGEFAEMVEARLREESLAFGGGAELRWRSHQQRSMQTANMPSLDPSQLGEVGWGVIFPQDTDPAVLDALRPLFDLRSQQAGSRFRIFGGKNGYQPGETKDDFLRRQRASPGAVDPERVPYYLLLVGDPREISFAFQRQLDVQYAVGRISFDHLEEYANYAANVVNAELGLIRPARQAAFFGVANPGDLPSRLAVDLLMKPLHQQMIESFKIRQPDLRVRTILRDATKAKLARLLSGSDAPSLLVASCHGLEFPPGDPRQVSQQGALLCGDWPGPENWRGGPIPESFYFSGDDLSPNADLSGLIALFFGCFSAGTPKRDELALAAAGPSADVAPFPFLARLPARMLGRRDGALAVVGVAGRIWSYSQAWQGTGATTAVFQSALEGLVDGNPVGMAMEYFDERYAETATMLDEELTALRFGERSNPTALASLWIAAQDTRHTVILGDPAVRLSGSQSP